MTKRCAKMFRIGGYEGTAFCERPSGHEGECDNSFVATRERFSCKLADFAGGESATESLSR